MKMLAMDKLFVKSISEEKFLLPWILAGPGGQVPVS
jgi:hypothetical protein